MSKDYLPLYYVFYGPVTGFKKSRNFASILRTLVTNFLGNIIGRQAQEHLERVEAFWRARECH